MLADIKPYLKDVAHRDAAPSDNSAKDAFAIPRNSDADIARFFGYAFGKTKFLQHFCVQSLHIQIRLHTMDESNTEFFGGFEQSKAQTWSRYHERTPEIRACF